MKLKSIRLFAAVSFVLSSASAFALPTASVPYLEKERAAPGYVAGYGFDGIVALSNCSGSLVRFQTSLPEEKAMVLTNGHCLANAMGGGMPKPGVVHVNVPAKRTMWVLDHTSGAKKGEIQATTILYATMTKTDVTLYQLSETYAEIEAKHGTHPFTLANHYPAVGEAIDIVSGYWRRGYSCRVDGIVNELREAGWTMYDSIRYSRPGCETIGGTSGSPIISVDSKEIVGINNTGNEDGQKCTMNNPCEVDARGTVTYEKGLSYGQETAWFYSCLTADRKIDLELTGCKLAKPASTSTNPAPAPQPRKNSTWPSSVRQF